MIYISVGTQKFQFNRLFNKIDQFKEMGLIEEEIYAQVGATTYVPKHYKYKDFITRDEHYNLLEKANLFVCHGGTSSIIEGLKFKKKIIVVPRDSNYGEHVDNHQFEISQLFYDQHYLEMVKNLDEEFMSVYNRIYKNHYQDYTLNKQSNLIDIIIEDIKNFLKVEEKK